LQNAIQEGASLKQENARGWSQGKEKKNKKGKRFVRLGGRWKGGRTDRNYCYPTRRPARETPRGRVISRDTR